MESKLLLLIVGTYSSSTLNFYTPLPKQGGPTGVENHPDVPQLLDGCLSNPCRAASSHQVHIWSLHLRGDALSVGWPWTLPGSSGCPEFSALRD